MNLKLVKHTGLMAEELGTFHSSPEVTVGEQFCFETPPASCHFAGLTALLLPLLQQALGVIATIPLLSGSMKGLLAVAAWQPVPCVWTWWVTQFLCLKIVLTAHREPESSL